jgi:fatty acid desaturase
MRIWRNSRWDGLLLGFSVAQFGVTLWFADSWAGASGWGRAGQFVTVSILTAYNIIVVSHVFAHGPWFVPVWANAVVSVLNSVNIGQSVQAYHLTHVRNHHRYNNDRGDGNGAPLDLSSTYRDGEHLPLLRYALGGACESMAARGRDLVSVTRLCRVGADETRLLSLVSRRESRRGRELGQVRADRAAHCLSLVAFAAISWQWTLLCYLPAYFLALAMVNVQNYYRHYGANPDDRAADAVSHYGKLYNLLTFNDGYHQEHHLRPGTHWSELPRVRETLRDRLGNVPRIVSPVPAMVGFLHCGRPLLHHVTTPAAATEEAHDDQRDGADHHG